jgi:hypothetical protein
VNQDMAVSLEMDTDLDAGIDSDRMVSINPAVVTVTVVAADSDGMPALVSVRVVVFGSDRMVTINAGGVPGTDANMVANMDLDVMVAIDLGRVMTRMAAGNSEALEGIDSTVVR